MFNCVPSDETEADKRFVADCYSVCQHSRKPLLAAVFYSTKIKRLDNRKLLQSGQAGFILSNNNLFPGLNFLIAISNFLGKELPLIRVNVDIVSLFAFKIFISNEMICKLCL